MHAAYITLRSSSRCVRVLVLAKATQDATTLDALTRRYAGGWFGSFLLLFLSLFLSFCSFLLGVVVSNLLVIKDEVLLLLINIVLILVAFRKAA
jgi:hypothetical protein